MSVGGGQGLQAWRKTEQPYSPNLSDSAECVILCTSWLQSPVPKFIDPVFAKTSPKCSFCMTENERFGFVFAKTESINSGAGKVFRRVGTSE